VPVSIEAPYPGDSWDWEDDVIPPTKVQSPAGPYAVGTTPVTLTVTDGAGATDSCQADVVVTCNQLPIVSVPPPITAEATGPDGAPVSFTVTATDYTRKTALTPDCTPASGSTFALGVSTVRCTATDANGTGTASFTVTVADTTPPAVTVPLDATVEATSADGAIFTHAAAATDLVDGVVPVSCTPASGSVFAMGNTRVSCTATDNHANLGSSVFNVKVKDTTFPIVTVPGPMTVEAKGPTGAIVMFSVTATDNIDGALVPSCTPASGSTFAFGPTSVTCTAIDTVHNLTTASFTVTVVDTTAPTLTLPTPITAVATLSGGAAVSYTATAIDLIDGAVPVTCTPASGSTFPIGVTTVTCRATDAHLNTGSGTFTVTVVAAITSVTLTADHAAPQAPGTTVTLTAVESGGTAPYQFKWWLYNGSAWTCSRSGARPRAVRGRRRRPTGRIPCRCGREAPAAPRRPPGSHFQYWRAA
jgi:hypothetical protein